MTSPSHNLRKNLNCFASRIAAGTSTPSAHMDTFGCPYCADGPGNRDESLTSCCVAALRPLLFANFGNQPLLATKFLAFIFSTHCNGE